MLHNTYMSGYLNLRKAFFGITDISLSHSILVTSEQISIYDVNYTLYTTVAGETN